MPKVRKSRFYFVLGLMLTFSMLGQASFATSAPEKNTMAPTRYFVVARTFPERIFVPASKDPVTLPLQKMLDIALMTEESLAKLHKIPGVEVVQSFAQEKWRNPTSKQEFVVWAITDQFLKGFKFADVPTMPPTGMLLTSKMMQRLAWKDGEQVTLEEPSIRRRSLTGQAFGYDSPMSQVIAKGEDLALVPLAATMRDAAPFISNPCVLIRLSANADLTATQAALANFVTKEAKPSLTGSVLVLKSLHGFVR